MRIQSLRSWPGDTHWVGQVPPSDLGLGAFAKYTPFRLHLKNGPRWLRQGLWKNWERDEMKWTVAVAGVLLCVAGVYALLTGSSIIQMERGWATFIAGAVLLGAGVVVLGMAVLIGRIEQLIAATSASGLRRRELPSAAADAAAMNRLQHALHDVPPPPREVSVEALPTLESLMPEAAAPEPASARYPKPKPKPMREPMREATREATPAPRPAALRECEFVFPPAGETEADGRVEPILPLKTGKYKTRTGFGWLRHGKSGAPVNRDMPAPLQQRRSPEERMGRAALARHAADEPVETAAPHLETVSGSRRAEVNEVIWPQVEADIVAVEEAAHDQQPAPVDPFSNDWLERALAGDDKPQETSLLTPPPSVSRAEPLEPPLTDDAQADREDVSQDDPYLASDKEPAAKDMALALDSAASHAAPVEIGRYRANDVAYMMFSDGSITAETPAGNSYRFMSLVELRAFIERGAT